LPLQNPVGESVFAVFRLYPFSQDVVKAFGRPPAPAEVAEGTVFLKEWSLGFLMNVNVISLRLSVPSARKAEIPRKGSKGYFPLHGGFTVSCMKRFDNIMKRNRLCSHFSSKLSI
jgi:hypothetical protein